ncbi:hypothetical protein [Nocardia sp. alder85J]|uniref:DUF7144 family membrane protein n=1 Tax=Nocardia sp. alder85J TaxID=2862949 RepID=UPI001CD5F82C|nr:hypothetical protein [Nocardia sp. alder85J]MCX4091033.1 hypothetical protein [Nocardia sp. alder85J]
MPDSIAGSLIPTPVHPTTPDAGLPAELDADVLAPADPTVSERIRSDFQAAAATIAAVTLLGIIGVAQTLEGISAITTTGQWDTTGWGIAHILLGALLVAAAAALCTGRTWAHATAIVVAVVAIAANLSWRIYDPAWSVLIIVLDALIIGAVVLRHRRTR